MQVTPEEKKAWAEDLLQGRQESKNCGTPEGNAAAVFPQQKITGSVLADPSVFTSFKQFF